MDFAELLVYLGLFLPPLAVSAWFSVSVILFLKADSANIPLKRKRKTMLIISSVVFGVMTAAIIALMIIFAIAITHM